MTAKGRYCLSVCYCGNCPHYKTFKLTEYQVLTLVAYLAHPPRQHSAKWYQDPGCRGERN